MKKLLKVTVVILALTMLVQTMPMSRAVEQPLNIPELTAEQAALAATSYADVEENRLDGPVAHLAEDESLRTENAMHMKNENRSNTVLMYPFHRDVHGYYHMAAGSYTLAQDAAYLDFSFVYYNQLNEAYFADAFVYVGNFSSDYDYNGSGLLTKVKSDDGKEVNITYNGNNDVTGVTQKQDGTTLNSASITYDGQR
ncbi:MAG: hypothetical protein FWE98_02620, partial [Oscillospiraceae bacterium]|nr:hypothetical protein [Oscillospiraceae bacterium]